MSMNMYTLADEAAPTAYMRWGSVWDWMKLPSENEERRELQNVPLVWHANAEQSGDEYLTRPKTINILPPCMDNGPIPHPVKIYPEGGWWPAAW
jgi:hypothetical protein